MARIDSTEASAVVDMLTIVSEIKERILARPSVVLHPNVLGFIVTSVANHLKDRPRRIRAAASRKEEMRIGTSVMTESRLVPASSLRKRHRKNMTPAEAAADIDEGKRRQHHQTLSHLTTGQAAKEVARRVGVSERSVYRVAAQARKDGAISAALPGRLTKRDVDILEFRTRSKGALPIQTTARISCEAVVSYLTDRYEVDRAVVMDVAAKLQQSKKLNVTSAGEIPASQIRAAIARISDELARRGYVTP